MRSIERTIVTLTLVSVLIPGLGLSQERVAGADSGTGHLIWGAVGIPGVALQGLPGAPVSDETGRYRARVPPGWSGTVTPSKPGYCFEPQCRQYSGVERDYLNEDYRPSVLTYTLSGSVGVAGVTLKGLPRDVVTDGDGQYTVKVEYGWSGLVSPSKTGYRFEPPSREYRSVRADLPKGDYTATVQTFTITGKTGVSGVRMAGLPEEVVSDDNGNYTARVLYGWTGMVKPEKTGYSFTPPGKRWDPVTADLRNQDFTPHIITFTIAGRAGVPNATLKGLPGDPVTDREGRYKAGVEYGWSGVVTPVKEGYVFEPERREYSTVTGSCPNEDYVARELTFRLSGNAALPGVVLQGLPGEVVTDAEGNYSAEVPYGWTGKVTPMFGDTQVRFEPASRGYSKVAGDVFGQDYRPAGPGAFPGAPPYGAAAPNIVVIPTREADPKTFVELREDMQVMLQIVREKLSEPRMILGVLQDYGDFFGGRDRTAQAFYLQGHAALFVLDVDFPLVASAPRAGGEQAAQQAVDPVWQRARERLYAPQNPMRYGARGRTSAAERMNFEQFQDEMIKTLKHAANIRAVEPNEWVILTIVGQSEGAAPGLPPGMGSYSTIGGGGWVGGSAYGGGGSFGAGGFGGGSGGGSGFYSSAQGYSGGSAGRTSGRPAPGPAAPATVLTIQAKKADIDAFAQGTLDFEQFKQKVKIFTY